VKIDSRLFCLKGELFSTIYLIGFWAPFGFYSPSVSELTQVPSTQRSCSPGQSLGYSHTYTNFWQVSSTQTNPLAQSPSALHGSSSWRTLELFLLGQPWQEDKQATVKTRKTKTHILKIDWLIS
jgi:hypothetical protein